MKTAVLYKSSNIIERDSLINQLKEAGIEALTQNRDMMINVAQEPNVAIPAINSFFQGYPIYVTEENLSSAQDVLSNFIRKSQEYNSDYKTDHFSKFLFSALFSFTVPVILHFYSLYHLRLAIKNKEPIPSFKLFIGLLLLVVIPTIYIWALI